MSKVTLAIPALLVVATGCDPVRTTSQGVLLQVTSSTSGQPVAGVPISLKYDYERSVPVAEQRPEPERPTYEWFSSTTDVNGQADVGVEWTVLDRTIWGKPPSWRDWVSGCSYLVKVAGDQDHEVLSLVMRPGASTKGRVFTVRTLAVEASRYIEHQAPDTEEP